MAQTAVLPDTQPLTFISSDARGRAAREAIRVHVVSRQHQLRKQRRKEGPGKASDRVYSSAPAFRIWIPTNGSQKHDAGRRAPTSRRGHREKSPPRSESTSIPASSRDDSVYSRHEAASVVADIRSPPIESAKGEATEAPEAMLFHYYLQYGGGSQVTHDLYRAYCETTATYSAFLAMVASNYSDENGEPPPLDPVELESLALRDVADQLSRSPKAPPCNTMLAVALLANYQAFRNANEVVHCHWNALHEMININGGIERFRMNQNLYTLFFWMEGVVLNGVEISIGQNVDRDHVQDTQNRELRGFLDKVRSTARGGLQVLGKPAARVGEPITTILATAPYKKDAYSINKWRNARLGCLVFFAAMFLQEEVLVWTESFYQALEAELLDRQRKNTLYPEELYFVLCHVSNQDDVCYLGWKTARLINAIKRLGPRDMHACHRLLCACLGFSDCFAFDLAFEDWNELSERLAMDE
ncbi:hypothetical protein B0A52_09788 [Exophiala mesophila]|uniref:Transcription factor domain-containing protein n=1 Tax=Exophiala mesophila TaxID=212818 RepID=A0A438MTF5_EXOME|nr:hypothetical protein B0A52_09788 [Exophiala mesophila]